MVHLFDFEQEFTRSDHIVEELVQVCACCYFRARNPRQGVKGQAICGFEAKPCGQNDGNDPEAKHVMNHDENL